MMLLLKYGEKVLKIKNMQDSSRDDGDERMMPPSKR